MLSGGKDSVKLKAGGRLPRSDGGWDTAGEVAWGRKRAHV